MLYSVTDYVDQKKIVVVKVKKPSHFPIYYDRKDILLLLLEFKANEV